MSRTYLVNEAMLIHADPSYLLSGRALWLMCKAFEDRSWVGNGFTYPTGEKGAHERVVALCMAAAILE